MNTPQFTPGWYGVPDKGQERYHDGNQWTDAYRPVVAPVLAPPAVYSVQAKNHGPAIASMVLGICSLVIWYAGLVTGIVGLILGALSLKHCQPRGLKRGRGMAIAGITCSIIALVLWLIVIIALAAVSNGSSDF